jgi:PAS domain S-box-containing protein
LVNDRATELFGLPQEQLVGKSIRDFAPEGFDFEAAWDEFQQSQRESDTFPLVRPDGTERLVEYSASTDIVPGQHLSVLRDVTDRRRRERRFRALVEESNDLIAVVDTDGSYQYVSPSVERILGYDPVEMIGETAWEYVHPDDREELVETFEHGVANPDANPVAEYRVRHADGSWRWMEARGNNQLDNPAVEGYVVNVRDVTERKERQQQSDLLSRVLRHNLRNDLNVIRSRAETIRNGTTNMIASSAEQIIETSDQLIETAEKEREMAELLQNPPGLEEFTVKPLLRDVVSSLRLEYPHATIAVDCDDDVTVQATKQFRQVIRELVTNAIVHDDSASPAVTVTVVQTAEDVRIEIADTGPRIPEMERDILIGNEERTPLHHGAGLDLHLVQLLVSRSGGFISIEQNSPTGNIVALELPE